MNELSGSAVGEAGVRVHPWSARMIRPTTDRGVGTPSSFLARTMTLERVSGAERLRISALGVYRCFINGQRVGHDVLTPGWTCYDARLSYQTYPVGHLLQPGENRIEIWLGDGWLRSQMMWRQFALFNVWGRDVAAIAELDDGAGQVLVRTDASWQSGLLPIRKSGIYFGEIFDARVEPEVSGGAEPIDFDMNRLIPHEIQPVQELAPLPVVRQWQDEVGTIFDFGQNCAGYVSFEVRGAAGAHVHVEHGEVLDEKGGFYNENYRTAEARLEYILNGSGTEVYRPYFTFQGFRFARVRIEGDAELVSIEAIPISSVTQPTGSFTSASPLVNRLVENTLWSQRANFIEVPTDCPQRDERLGWTGDAQVFAGTACYLHDSHQFFVKYLRDVMVDQRADGAIPHVSPDPTRLDGTHYPIFHGSTGWGDAICVIPWQLYVHYGDRDILAETLPAMERWVDFVWSISDGPIVHPPRGRLELGFTFGDWLQPSGPTNKPWPTIGDDAAATIYLFIASTLTARIAGILGNTELERRMRERASLVKEAFEHEFIAPSGRLTYDDQTSYALAILYDLLPEKHLEAAKRYFKAAIERTEGRIGTGFIGTPALLPALIKIGEPELAARMFLQEEVPGWLFQVKMGATSIWERWDSLREDGSINGEQMNSYNHYAYGAVCQWLFESVAGFRPDSEHPSFRHILFEPTIIPELSPVKAHHDSATGRIEAGWTAEGNTVTYEITVPEGARGTLRLSDRYRAARLDGEEIGATAELQPGQHTVTFELA